MRVFGAVHVVSCVWFLHARKHEKCLEKKYSRQKRIQLLAARTLLSICLCLCSAATVELTFATLACFVATRQHGMLRGVLSFHHELVQ